MYAKLSSAFKLFLSVTTLCLSSQAWAYYTVQDTGNLLKPNQMDFSAELQFITHGDTNGANVIGHFNKGFNEESNFRFEAGAGTTDAVIGAYYKWVPFPDTENQPAVGFEFGPHYAHYDSKSEFAVRVIPIISKNFVIDAGIVTPYAALPLAFASYDGHGRNPINLVLGSRYHHNDIKQIDFTAELGFDINQAPNSITVGVVFPAFDGF